MMIMTMMMNGWWCEERMMTMVMMKIMVMLKKKKKKKKIPNTGQISHQTALPACCRTIMFTNHIRLGKPGSQGPGGRGEGGGRWGWWWGEEGELRGTMHLWWKQEPDSPVPTKQKMDGLTRRSKVARHTKLIRLHSQITLPPDFSPLAIIGAKSRSSWKSCYAEEKWARNVIFSDARYQNEMRKRGVLWCYLAGGDFDGGGKSKKSEKEKAPRRKSSIYIGAWEEEKNAVIIYCSHCLHTRMWNAYSESG